MTSPVLSDLLEVVEVPIALLEIDGVTVRWVNPCFTIWVPDITVGGNIADVIPAFASPRALRGLTSGKEHSVPCRAPDKFGRERDVEYRRRPCDFHGDSLWIVEGLDRSKAEVKQRLLDSHARTIEKNNRRLARREAKLKEQNAAMQLVLDNITDGLFLISRDGTVSAKRSAICDAWFGTAGAVPASDFLSGFDRDAAAWFELSFEAVAEGILPLEFTLPQLPTVMCRNDQHLALKYVPITHDEVLQHLLVVATDVTADLEQAKAKAHEQDVVELTRRLLRDPNGMQQFMEEIEEILETLVNRQLPREDVLRLLHTVKGNCALFGANAISSACHDLESEVADLLLPPSREALTHLRDGWNRLAGPVRSILTSGERSVVELSDRELTLFCDLVDHCDTRDVSLVAQSWKNPPVRSMLAILGEQAFRLAQRLAKEVDVAVEDHGIRLPLKPWRSFWSSLNHVVRNAVDHGLESAEERVAVGKSPRGLLTLSADVVNDCVVVRLSDDGKGIDWDLVAAARRRRQGDVEASRDDLVAELLSSGFSTREQATEISGRGVGLDAVAVAVREVGGSLHIDSSVGQGTTFEFRFADPQLVSLAKASRMAASWVMEEQLNNHSSVARGREGNRTSVAANQG